MRRVVDPVDRAGQALPAEMVLAAADVKIGRRFQVNRNAQLAATIPGVSTFVAVAIACRTVPIERFPRPRSLANFLGLTRGCRSSGDTERMGSITTVVSRMVRLPTGPGDPALAASGQHRKAMIQRDRVRFISDRELQALRSQFDAAESKSAAPPSSSLSHLWIPRMPHKMVLHAHRKGTRTLGSVSKGYSPRGEQPDSTEIRAPCRGTVPF